MTNYPVYDKEHARAEFARHGEDWILLHLRNKLFTIFDAGSNIGEWCLMARSCQPYADIHTFEIVPDVYRKFLANVPSDPKIIPNGFGLSNMHGMMEIQYSTKFDAVSSLYSGLNIGPVEVRNCFVATGDEYVESRKIDFIDFLKIDVEGAEGMVIEGFTKTLENNKIGIIQFEYGFANVLSRWLLLDAYNKLLPLGFHLGLLNKNGLEFKNYKLTDENFGGPNYVAVHNSKMHLFR